MNLEKGACLVTSTTVFEENETMHQRKNVYETGH